MSKVRGYKTLTCSCGRLSYKVSDDTDRVVCWLCLFERNFGKIDVRDRVSEPDCEPDSVEPDTEPDSVSSGSSEEPKPEIDEDPSSE